MEEYQILTEKFIDAHPMEYEAIIQEAEALAVGKSMVHSVSVKSLREQNSSTKLSSFSE
jgi:hypothetical protein